MATPAAGSAQALAEAKWTPEERYNNTDWTNRDSIMKNFPIYIQEQYEAKKANKKALPKAVNIENFTMKTPFGDQTLLKQTELVIEANKRQGLIGVNNSGKTLLFHNMMTGGIKDFPKHIHVHHCKELETHELSDTVLGQVVNSYPYLNLLRRCEKTLTEKLNADPKPEEDVAAKLQENLDYIKFSIQTIKGYDAEDRAAKMLRVLGFDETGQKKLCSELSGGLRMRVALCMAFFIEADLLLLDEPTNHLDFPSVLWLENRLRGYKGSFLLVSHDRELLNNVCTSVMLLEDQQIKYYACGFKDFEKKKVMEDKKKFEDIEKFLIKNPNPDPSTMLGRQRAEKKEWSEKYYAKQVALAGKFTFPVADKLENKEVGADGKPVPEDQISLIRVENVRFSYKPEAEHPVFIFNDPISFNVTASTRVGVLGPNGAGKSTFLKLVTKKIHATTGKVTEHPNFKLAYFGQHSTAELDLELTPSEFMQREFPNETTGALKNHLAKTSITGTTADTRMHRLSFSQRSCIIFAKLTYVAPHLLILDEPTNFLDLESVDSLISACNKYKGALLLVSHNRDFLRRCGKEFLSIVPGQFALFGDLKTAERATYTFIAEMEEGGSVSGKSMALNTGGGSVHASQIKGTAAEGKVASTTITEKTIGGGAKPAAAAVKAAPVEVKVETYTVNERCQALWTDGKFYNAVVKKVVGTGKDAKYAVTYTEYGNTATVEPTKLKKVAKPAAAAAPKK